MKLTPLYIYLMSRVLKWHLLILPVQSLTKHIEELTVLMSDWKLDILAINEMRLDTYIQSSEIAILGYDLIRRDRVVNGRNGGGVAFYVRSNISYVIRDDLNIAELQNLSTEIRKPRSKSFIVITWHRPPCSKIEIFNPFEVLVQKLDLKNVEFYILGNFNCDLAPARSK